MSPTRTTRRILAVILAGAAAVPVLAGCNVDPAFRDRQTVNGPTMSSERPTKPGSVDSGDVTIIQRREADLVESVAAHRAAYRKDLEQLRRYYRERGYATKESWAAFEISGLSKVKQFRYLMDAEIPSDLLRAAEQIPEADELYQQGLALMRKGGHKVPVFYSREAMLQAVGIFRKLIQDFPSSDKIDDAAFMCGEIHAEYLPNQETLAVKWYERAWTWNPETPHPARFQAATVYDYRLHDRDQALELYQLVLTDEVGDKSNLRTATRRISKLSASDGPVPAYQP
jgi:tetratricopeptide (TPR) repeat protein